MSTHNTQHHATPVLNPLGSFFDSFVRQIGGIITTR